MTTHPYATDDFTARKGPFVVLEGVSGIGKSTLARVLTARLDATLLHTVSHPHRDLTPDVNAALKPLPQLAFYLSGALHVADIARRGLEYGPVVADRYISSVVACHAAVHGVPLADVAAYTKPFREYMARPDWTFYLRCSESTLRDRHDRKPDVTSDDRGVFGVPGRLAALLANYGTLAEMDPTGVMLDTDGYTPDELAAQIVGIIEELAEAEQ